jgi:hypothetical protein
MSKNIQEYANEYYRPSADDDDLSFFPSQGTMPIYHYVGNQWFPHSPSLHRKLNLKGGIKREPLVLFKEEESNFIYIYASIFFFIFFFLINVRVVNHVLKQFFSLLPPFRS